MILKPFTTYIVVAAILASLKQGFCWLLPRVIVPVFIKFTGQNLIGLVETWPKLKKSEHSFRTMYRRKGHNVLVLKCVTNALKCVIVVA